MSTNYKIIFYDFETYIKDWLVVFIDYNTREKTIILNDPKELKQFYEQHKDDILIGYNSRNFDQFILKGILLGKDPFIMTKQLIEEGKKGFQILRSANKIKLNNFDVSTGFHSLKQLEAFMGNMIKESSIPFDIQRKLTKEEIEETIKYCSHDVSQTIEVFERRKEEFTSQLGLIEAFNLDMGQFNKTKAQLSAHILGAIKQESIDDEFNFTIPKCIKLDKYKFIYDWYMNPRNWTYERKLEVDVAGVPHIFGFGGVHGAIPNCIEEGIILCMDVSSLYPSIMINFDFLSRNVTEPNKFAEIRDTRLKYKAAKNPLQAPLKIVINGTFGASKDRNNSLFDPLMANNVCISGQLLLLDLIEKIESYGKILQSNTDGVYIKVDSIETADKIKSIAHEWEARTGLELEFELATKLIQKDVNNYLLIHEDGTFKTKGAYVKKLKEIDNDLPIVNKALIEYFIHNTSPEETINKCDDLIEFQKVVKITGLYKYAWFGKVISEKIESTDGKPIVKSKMTEGSIIKEKVLRVFASKDENAPGVYKVKSADRIEKIANTPDRCFINNESVIGVKIPEYLDKQYYIDIAKDRIAKFIEPNEENKITAEQQILEVLNKNHEHFYNVLVDIKENTNVGFSTLEKFIKIDVFKRYGKVNKILQYIEYFKTLYNKKNPKEPTLKKTINLQEIFAILEANSEFDHGQKITKKKDGTVKIDPKVPTYNKLNYEKALKEIWDFIINEDISTYEKIRQEFDLYDDVTIINNNIDASELFILAVNETKNPSIIAYCINNGVIQFLKVNKQLFNILEIRQGDIIKANDFDLKPCVKVVGKDKDGINIIGKSPDRTEWWLTKYEIIDRNYVKNNKLIVDEEQE